MQKVFINNTPGSVNRREVVSRKCFSLFAWISRYISPPPPPPAQGFSQDLRFFERFRTRGCAVRNRRAVYWRGRRRVTGAIHSIFFISRTTRGELRLAPFCWCPPAKWPSVDASSHDRRRAWREQRGKKKNWRIANRERPACTLLNRKSNSLACMIVRRVRGERHGRRNFFTHKIYLLKLNMFIWLE